MLGMLVGIVFLAGIGYVLLSVFDLFIETFLELFWRNRP